MRPTVCLMLVLLTGCPVRAAAPTEPDDARCGDGARCATTSSAADARTPPYPCGPVQGPDADGDRMTDAHEQRIGTSAHNVDTDGDGKSDAAEACHFGTDPLRADTDGDGVPDGAELARGRDPRLADGPVPQGPAPQAREGLPHTATPPALPSAPLQPQNWSCASFQATDPRSASCFLPVGPASFWLGAQATDPSAPGYDVAAQASEGPVHSVTIGEIWLMKHEVSEAHYAACAAAGACPPLPQPRPTDLALPVTGLTAAEAQAVCHFLGARLPTEAEWDFAARGEARRRWADNAKPQPSCDTITPGLDGVPQRVATPPDGCGVSPLLAWSGRSDPGPFGHVHLTGNVSEWTSDAGPSPGGTGALRIVRGGSHMMLSALERRASVRAGVPEGARLPDLGVRCAADAP